jgi:hypothetical protein
MKIDDLIRELQGDVERIQRAICCLEQLRGAPLATDGNDARATLMKEVRDPRGRKSMGPEERQQVSERMKRYWASRRRQSR